MDFNLVSLLFAAFTESYIVYQIIIYAPFYITEETHALESTVNLFVALTLSSYPFGLISGHKARIYIQTKHGPKRSLLINFAFNMIALIIMSDSMVFDRSIYHFVIGMFIMGFSGNSWNNILSISHSLELDYKHNELYCYISASHGIGCILAGVIGAFFNINNGVNIQFIDTPFLISICLCSATIFCIHFKLNLEEYTTPKISEDDNDDEVNLLQSHQDKDENETLFNSHHPNDGSYKNVLFWYHYDYASDTGESVSFYDSVSLLVSNKLYLLLLALSILILMTIFSFDILFPTYSSISSIHGGMGWSSKYIGLFYTFYAFSWQF